MQRTRRQRKSPSPDASRTLQPLARGTEQFVDLFPAPPIRAAGQAVGGPGRWSGPRQAKRSCGLRPCYPLITPAPLRSAEISGPRAAVPVVHEPVFQERFEALLLPNLDRFCKECQGLVVALAIDDRDETAASGHLLRRRSGCSESCRALGSDPAARHGWQLSGLR